jgi:endonuclease/exonuclease/phosphatase family metal-dependent hydrolase/GNAT superfamily N-acetyltransferase
VIFEELGEFAARITDPSTEPLHFARPEITVETLTIEGYDCPGVAVLHARLRVWDLNNPDLQITVGHADLLSLEISQVADFHDDLTLLTAGGFWDDLAPWSFAGLFREADEDSLFRRYPKHHLKTVIIVRDIFIDPLFRGHQLAAWMLAEVAANQHDSPTLLIGQPRSDDLDVDEDDYWKDALNATQFDWRYQTVLADSPGIRAAREKLSSALPQRFSTTPAAIRDRYDTADQTLWPRSLLMPPLRLDLREVEYQQLESEILSPSTEWSRRQEIHERLEEIREEKNEELKDWERAHGISEDPPQEVGDNEDEEADIDEDTETAAGHLHLVGGLEFDRQGPWPNLQEPVTELSVLSWNVGHRITRKPIPSALGEALISLGADVLFLNEFVDGGPDRDALREQLRDAGYLYFATSTAPPRHNQVFAASRLPIEIGDINAPTQPDSHAQTNFLHIRLPGSDLDLIGLRAPAYKSAAERRAYWSDLTAILRGCAERALVVVGDLNLDPFRKASGDSIAFPEAEMFRAVRPDGPWSFASLHDSSRNSRIDHVLHTGTVSISEPRYLYAAGGVDLAGTGSPHKGDHAVLMFRAGTAL